MPLPPLPNHLPLEQLPIVDPMMVRRFYFKDGLAFPAKGGLAAIKEITCKDVGLADKRREHDEDVVDCSYAMLDLTTELIFINARAQKQQPGIRIIAAYFNGRRWRSHRQGKRLSWPDDSLLYIGNPILIEIGPDGLTVRRMPEFRIRSGAELQVEMDVQQ